MTIYTNPTGTFNSTSGDDTIIFDRPPADSAFIDAVEGFDTVIADFGETFGSSLDFEVSDSFNSGELDAWIRTGVYDPRIWVTNAESVIYRGGAANDSFDLKIGPQTSDVSVDLDGRGGRDTLTFDWSWRSDDFSFVVSGAAITSSFGTFANIEQFTIHAGSGNDVVQTGNYSDNIYTGQGADTVNAGGGNDYIYSESSSGLIDGGSGSDHLVYNLTASTSDITVDIDRTVHVSNGLTASNIESGQIGTGSGQDYFNVTMDQAFLVDGGDGRDTLTYSVAATQSLDFTFHADGGSFWGTAGLLSFGNVERLELHGGAQDDSFTVVSYPYQPYAAAGLLLDGGDGVDSLTAYFGSFTDGSTFIVAGDGSISSNRGSFMNFESLNLTGSDADDTFITGSGDDSLFGEGGNDVLDAGAGNDTLVGGDGADHLMGGTGNDIFYGENPGTQSADIFEGGAGDDLYSRVGGSDTIIELAEGGFDSVESAIEYVLPDNVEALQLLNGSDIGYNATAPVRGTGNSSGNSITGNDTANLLSGLDGNDALYGMRGDDTLDGGSGDDILHGGEGDDLLNGGSGSDTASYIDAMQWVEISLAVTTPQPIAWEGSDTLTSIENLEGSTFSDRLTGDDGANVLSGAGGDDRLFGNAGNDTLDGGLGLDRLYGGFGDDTYVISDSTDYAYENAGEGVDSVIASVSHVLRDNFENLTLTGTANLVGNGNSLDNVLTGNSGANRLYGVDGDDTIHGGGGNDRIEGGAGLDRLFGGSGNDVYAINDGDLVYEDAGGGTDTVYASVDYRMAGNVERLYLTGDAALRGTGSSGDNIIVGNGAGNVISGMDGNDTLYGQGGNDRIDGGAGLDRLIGGEGNDVYYIRDTTDYIYEAAGEGTDTVYSAISHALRANVERLILTGTDAVDGTGNELANRINGNDAANVLRGAGGNDVMQGGGGNDILSGGDGNDVLQGSAGIDRLYGDAGADRFVFDDGDFGSSRATADRIHDFSRADGDTIRLDLADADTTTDGDQAFGFIGSDAFHGVAGELRYEQIGSNTYVQGDTDGDGVADFWILMDGLHTMTGSDFIL